MTFPPMMDEGPPDEAMMMGGGMDPAMAGDPMAAGGAPDFGSLDPQVVATVLAQVLQRMQEDDQYAMQVQLQMQVQAMGQQQAVAQEQALAALQEALAADGQTLDGPASMPPPGAELQGAVPPGEMEQIMRAAFPPR